MVNRQARSVARVNVHCDINMIRRIKGAVEDSLFLYVRRLPHFIPNATAPCLFNDDPSLRPDRRLHIFYTISISSRSPVSESSTLYFVSSSSVL